MSWNYRLCKKIFQGVSPGVVQYGLHEVYYNEDGKVDSISCEPVQLLYFEDDENREADDCPYEAMNEELKKFNEALGKPVLDLDDEGKIYG